MSEEDEDLHEDVLEQAENLIAARRFEEAVDTLRTATVYESTCAKAFLLRADALSLLAKKYLDRPPSHSERSALFGLDPTTLAEMAIADANKAIDLEPTLVAALLVKARSFALQKNFTASRAAYLDCFQRDSSNQEAIDGIKQMDSIINIQARRTVERSDDFDCVICMKLILEPITTPCGHTFCRSCLARSIDHQPNTCPTCRATIHVHPPSAPVSVTLHNIIRTCFPEEHAQREKEMQEVETHNNTHTLPLFVMCSVLPFEPQGLNIFEPRYRLMIRRVMAGSRRLGMVAMTGNELRPVAYECEIRECTPQPDGRFTVRMVGKSRVRILSCTDVDGYRVATVEPYKDAAESPEKLQELQDVVAEVEELISNMTQRIAPPQRQQLRSLLGEQPKTDTPEGKEALSFWALALVELSERDKIVLGESASTLARTRFVVDLLRGPRRGACPVM
eukprot:c32733_g1_i1.p1 GENE.c32733_g1_i1~~c32733_g1_i1.p1  ORF type:complete len:468 (+),score=108.09 c32733_g1_i1:57-1406(+)